VSRWRAWVQASRPLAQANLALPLLLGQALAWSATGRFSWRAFALVHAFGLVDQLLIVWANDYADADADRTNRTFTRFSGGSRVLPQGLLAPRALRHAAVGAAAALIALASAAWLVTGQAGMMLATAAAIALLWAYSFPPLRLSYRGGGELLQGLGMGIVLPALGYWAQAGELSSLAATALLATFLLGWLGNVTTALPDHPSDAHSSKRSWPVLVGPARARRHTLVLLVVAACATPLVVPGRSLGTLAAIVLPVWALAAANVPALARAEAHDRPACARFVALNATALAVLWSGWAIAARWAPPG
jgi:1,4-dihydroxy-2-naphthoate octaprenyltransferase